MSRNPYVRPVSKTGWWLKHPRYLRYMSREVTCIFIGALAMLMLWGLKRLSEGPAAYEAFLASLKSPAGVVILLLILLLPLYFGLSAIVENTDRIAAWSSDQSRSVEGRAQLDERYDRW